MARSSYKTIALRHVQGDRVKKDIMKKLQETNRQWDDNLLVTYLSNEHGYQVLHININPSPFYP